MCTHRGRDRWSRLWSRLCIAWVVSFIVPEVYGLIRVGPEATLSHYLQRLSGSAVPCRHTTLGRTVVCAFSLWLAAHIGWSRFGSGGRLTCRRKNTPSGDPRCPH